MTLATAARVKYPAVSCGVFHFLYPTDSLKEESPWLEKAMLADSLLGMELLENAPVSGTASPSNMDL